jgi:hypothetical protein
MGEMNMKLNLKQASISLGIVFGAMHFLSVLLITQSNGMMVNWWMNSHHMQFASNIIDLNIFTLILGTISTSIIGALVGALFVIIWNHLDEVGANED